MAGSVIVVRGGGSRARPPRLSDRLPCPQALYNPQYSERHYYPSKAPLLSFAAAPVYGALKLLHGDVPELALMFFARLVVRDFALDFVCSCWCDATLLP